MRRKDTGRMERKLNRRTDRLFFTLLCPSSLFAPIFHFFLCGHCRWMGRWQVLVPTQFLSHEEKNGLRFPRHALSSPPGWQACLFVFHDIGRHLNSPVKRQHNAPGRNQQLRNEARGSVDNPPPLAFIV